MIMTNVRKQPILAMMAIVPALGALPSRGSEHAPFLLQSGSGCEHSVVATLPNGRPVAITSRTEHRGFRKAPKSSLGFAFIGIKSGVPVLLGEQPPDSFPILDGDATWHTWQALDWSNEGPLAEHGALLAAAPTVGRYEGTNSRPRPRVEFFTWSQTARDQLKRCKMPTTPFLGVSSKYNINAITLAKNGDVYASVLGKKLMSGIRVVCEEVEINPSSTKIEPNSVYLWRPGWKIWKRVASGIPTANGLYLSGDGKVLLTNSFVRRSVVVFARNVKSGLLSHSHTIQLNKHHNPDNLSPLDASRASVMATPGILSGTALVLGGCFGTHFGLRPTATILEIDSKRSVGQPRSAGRVPMGIGVFSDATLFEGWWLCGQMIGNGIYCMPATEK